MNEAPNTVKLYSSMTKLTADSNSLVPLASLTALTDLLSVTIPCWGINYKENQEGETIEGGGNAKADLTFSRGAMTIKTDNYYTASDMNFYFSTLKLLRQNARYMQIVTSEISEYISNTELFGLTTQAISIVIPEIAFDEENYKVLNLTVEKSEPYA